MNMQAMGSFKPITALCLPLYIKPRIFTKRQCKLQRCDWSGNTFLVCARYEYAGYG